MPEVAIDVTVDRGIAAPTAAPEPDVRLSPHPAHQKRGVCHADLFPFPEFEWINPSSFLVLASWQCL